MKPLYKFKCPATQTWHVCQTIEEVKSILEPHLLTASQAIENVGYENVIGVHPDTLWEKMLGGDYGHGLRVCAEIHFACFSKIQHAETHFDDSYIPLID